MKAIQLPMHTYNFDTDTQPLRSSEGSVDLHLSDRYDIGDKPNGGYVLASIARGLATVVGHQHPVSIAGHYLRPSVAGAGTIELDAPRIGRTFSTASGRFIQGGKERVRSLATFADLDRFEGPTLVTGRPPAIAPMDQCFNRKDETRGPSLALSHSITTLVDRSRSHCAGHELEVHAWFAFADGRPLDVWSLPLLVDAGPPTAFGATGEPSWVPTLELTCHIRAIPVGTHARGVFRTRFLNNGLCEEDGELWDERDVLVAQSRQLAMLRPHPSE